MIVILGSGTMGKGISIEFARSGFNVLLISVERHLDPDIIKKDLSLIIQKYNIDESTRILNNINISNKLSDIKDCTLLVEAVSENISKKRAAISASIPYISDNTILASNTSSLSIKEIFNDLVDLKNVVGLHFFNPVQVMKLIEVSLIKETSKECLDTVEKIINDIEKEFVIVKDSTGFIVNRVLIPMINEAARLLDEEVATAEDIDKALKLGANHPIGPLKLSDLIGNDIVLAILYRFKDNNPNLEISKYLIDLVNQNKLGRKTKIGFFNYNK